MENKRRRKKANYHGNDIYKDKDKTIQDQHNKQRQRQK